MLGFSGVKTENSPVSRERDSGPDVKRPRGSGLTAMVPILGSMMGSMSSSGMSGGGSSGGGRSTKVIQLRNLPDQVMEADLIDTCSQFGNINYVNLTGRGNALLEFETTDLFVCNQPTYVNYAPVEEIPRRGLESPRPSCVLVMQVQNPKYPITTMTRLNVIRNDQDSWDYTGGAAGGNQNRPSLLSEPPSGRGAGDYGGGDELGYDEFGRPIFDEMGGPMGGGSGGVAGGGMGVFGSIGSSGGASGRGMPGGSMGGIGGAFGGNMGSYGDNNMMRGGGYSERRGDFYDEYDRGYDDDRGGRRGAGEFGGGRGGGGYDMGRYEGGMGGRMSPMYGSGGPGGYGGSGGPGGRMGAGGAADYMGGAVGNQEPDGSGFGKENSVVMVYGLSEKFNCEKLFNMACLYGNVVRIKFLKSKSDAAMVQMGDPVAAERCIRYLNKMKLFDKQIQLTLSKKPYLEDMRTEPYPLPDNTPSYKDYTDARSNRYLTPAAAARNRINAPSNSLYFFNAPPDLTDEKLNEMIEEHDLPKPSSIKMFDTREGSRSKAGLMEFENESIATECIAMVNHVSVNSETSRTPYLIKFTFSGPPGSDTGAVPSRGGGRGGGRDMGYRDSHVNGPEHLVEGRLSRGGGRGGRGGGSERGGGRGGPRGGGYSDRGGRGGGGDRGRGRGSYRGRGAGGD